jgi:hypothetical protein
VHPHAPLTPRELLQQRSVADTRRTGDEYGATAVQLDAEVHEGRRDTVRARAWPWASHSYIFRTLIYRGSFGGALPSFYRQAARIPLPTHTQ